MTIIFRGYHTTGNAPKFRHVKSAHYEYRRAKNGRMVEVREYWEEIPDIPTFPPDNVAKWKIYEVEKMLRIRNFLDI